jgi:RND family efflux transporter MFP subunit
VLAALSAATTAGACKGRRERAAGTPDATAEAALPVVVAQPARGDIAEEIVVSATLRSRHAVEVVSETVGLVRRVLAAEGQRVAEGELLAELGHPPARLALQRAQLGADRAQAELTRLRPLADKEAVSRKTIDDAKFAVRQADTELERARQEVANLRVTATMAGAVVRRHAEAGQRLAPGAPLFSLADVDRLEAVIRVPERLLPVLAVGLPARLTAEALPGVVVDGHVQRVSPVVDPQSGTVEVAVTLDAAAPDGAAAARPRPGMFVAVRIVVDVRRDALLLPKGAVAWEDGRAVVFTVDQAAAAPRVRPALGLDDGRRVQVLGGLDEGARVVVQGQDRLKDGTPVRIVPARVAPPDGGGPETFPAP